MKSIFEKIMNNPSSPNATDLFKEQRTYRLQEAMLVDTVNGCTAFAHRIASANFRQTRIMEPAIDT
jgi:hypothetical protein